MSIRRSISGYIKGTFTPQGWVVADFIFRICSISVSQCIEPAPSKPRPPLLLTADAKRQPLHQTIPPCMMGYFMPNKCVILFMYDKLMNLQLLYEIYYFYKATKK